MTRVQPFNVELLSRPRLRNHSPLPSCLPPICPSTRRGRRMWKRARDGSRRLTTTHSQDPEAGITLSNIPIDTNYSLPSAGPGQTSQQASTVLNDFRRKREAAAVAVPTDDKRVRADLRARGQPITLFGERPEDRRDRLREILYTEQAGGEDESMLDVGTPVVGDAGVEGEEEDGDEEFYTEGSTELLHSRQEIARYSLPRAEQRIRHQRLESTIPVSTHVRHRKAMKARLAEFEMFGSQIASERPVSMVRFAPGGEVIACGDWAGSIKVLDVPNLETKGVLRGHKSMVGGISWYGPAAGDAMDGAGTLNLASGGGEGDVNLWSYGSQDTPIATLSGHSARVVRTEFHPSGRYLASASYDTTWRLWDVNTTTQLLLQEGHSKEVYTVSFSPDGSLLASAGLDSIGRIWDLRTGRTIMLLESHVAPIHALDWSPDGVRVMTGSADGFAKCWDVRAVRESASLGAHKGGVSDLRWFKGTDGPLSGKTLTAESNGSAEMDDGTSLLPKKSGTFVLTAGFDHAVNIFSADDWALCKSLTGHDGTVLAVDTTEDARWIASCGRDRTVKLWAMPDEQGL
ncbi:WD40-repeat-containing domain protein [Neohortaea acidophila]|uniref:WD40-repeat-containing domain protein n=1 Tax=Neohortaea acidophila TaxID=245834 RepID=A0A6A6PKL1_9PEZI|nr:WD40-repeat-containing domain protein [Neohortaea acidophila]KAF2480455.1 WD40-repeat-containing domain protein [Neohortaea acidophila]